MVVMVTLGNSLGDSLGDSQGRARARVMVEVTRTLARKVQGRAQVPATVEVVRHPTQMAGLTRTLNRETILGRRCRTKGKPATASLIQ